ncbi:hypothetical protein ACSBR2_008798 [Camellia fascicularis]
MNQYMGQRSYVEVVKKCTTVEGEIVTVKAEEIGNGWLNESVILRMKTKHENVNLKMELEERRMKEIVVRKGGGRDMILSFKSKKEMNSKVKDVKEMIGDWSEDVVT